MPAGAIVGDHVAPPGHTNQELLERAMGMFAPNMLASYVKNQEIALHLEGNLTMNLAKTEAAAQIFGSRQLVNRGLAQRNCVANFIRQPGSRCFRRSIH